MQIKHASGDEATLSLDEFLERVCFMREIYHDYLNTKKLPKFSEPEADPFFIDTSKASDIGEARVYLEPLGYLFDISDQMGLLDGKGANK